MIPIAYSSKETFGEHGFLEHLLELCKEHKKDERALAFAFIIYDFRSPSIRKVITDNEYWDALDTLSGKYLSVFYFNEPVKKQNRRTRSQYSDHDTISLMIGIDSEASINNASSFLKNYFKVAENVSTPFVIFFQTDDQNIINSFVVKLKKSRVEDSFYELKRHIENAVNSIENVESEYFNNHEEIFNLVESGVTNGQFVELIKTKIYQPISIAGTIGGFANLFL